MIQKYLLIFSLFFALHASHNVGVFCAADDQIPETYKQLTYELGRRLREAGLGLVTGGSNSGLMNVVVNGYADLDGAERLFGIIPSVFKSYNVHHPKIPKGHLIWVDGIYQRLQSFHDKCDTMVVLPGGFGTLHELMDFMVPKQWGMSDKKVILLNVDGYWDGLMHQFQVMVEKKALKQKHLDLLTVVSTVEECMHVIQVQEGAHPGLQDRYWEKEE
jgi:hypothetical protein